MSYETPEGDRYTGQWLKDRCHGKGIKVGGSVGDRYKGEWREDKREGKGVYKARLPRAPPSRRFEFSRSGSFCAVAFL